MDLLSYDIFNKELLILEKKFDNDIFKIVSMDEISLYTEAAKKESIIKKIKDAIISFIKKIKDTINTKIKELKKSMDIKKIKKFIEKYPKVSFPIKDYADNTAIFNCYKKIADKNIAIIKKIANTNSSDKREKILEDYIKYMNRIDLNIYRKDCILSGKNFNTWVESTNNIIKSINDIENVVTNAFSDVSNVVKDDSDLAFSNMIRLISQKFSKISKDCCMLLSGNVGKIVAAINRLNAKVITITITKKPN